MDGVLNLEDRLRSGMAVKCPKCKNGTLLPFNTTVNKAHDFNCNNEKCDFYIHYESSIDID